MAYVNFVKTKTEEEALAHSIINTQKVFFSTDTTNIINSGIKYGSIAENIKERQEQDATFTTRTTGDGLNFILSRAAIHHIKGNSCIWNQLYNNAVPAVTSGHKYFISETVSGNISKKIATDISYTSGSTSRMCIDLTLLLGSGKEPATVEAFEEWLDKYIGLKNYYAYNEGELLSVKSTALATGGVDGWSNTLPLNITKQKGRVNGTGPSVTVFPDGMKSIGDIYDEIFIDRGEVKAIKRVGSRVYNSSTDSSAYTDGITTYYVLTAQEEYILDEALLPGDYRAEAGGTEQMLPDNSVLVTGLGDVTTIKGKKNGTGESVVVFPDGLKTLPVGISDTVNMTYARKHIVEVALNGLTFTDGEVEIEYDEYESEVAYWHSYHFTLPEGAKLNTPNQGVCAGYTAQRFLGMLNCIVFDADGTGFSIMDEEWSPVVNPDEEPEAIEAREAGFRAKVASKIVQYALATPEEYLVDTGSSCSPTMTILYGIDLAELATSYYNFKNSFDITPSSGDRVIDITWDSQTTGILAATVESTSISVDGGMNPVTGVATLTFNFE